MAGLFYLWKRNFINKFKKAFKRPITYFYVFLILVYGIGLPFALSSILVEFHLDTPEGMTYAATIVCFYLIPANMLAYAKRKGLLFKKSDVNFLFTTPIGPKKILVYTHLKAFTMSLLLGVFVMIAGIFIFHLSPLQLILFFIVNFVLEDLLEGSIMMLCYGSEKISDGARKLFVGAAYGLVACFLAIGVILCLQRGFNIETATYFLHSDAVQMVPIIGWFIACIHLIFMGPTTVNVICSGLYLLLVIVTFVLAFKMKCTGEYYEDAEKFADDYEELKTRREAGDAAKMGKKEKFGVATVEYKGSGAKAIFYKQLLEYKKTKTFLLDKTNLLMIAVGIFWAYMMAQGEERMFQLFVMPMAMVYIVICTTAMNGKWGKEIKCPYTFLIPDTAVKKLWYATLMEHIKNFIYGILFAIPCGIILHIPVTQTILCILMYMMLQANKLYSLVMMEALVGSTMGRVGKQLFHMFLQGIPMMLAMVGAIVGVLMASFEVAYLAMTIILAACVAIFITLAAFCFEKMETA